MNPPSGASPRAPRRRAVVAVAVLAVGLLLGGCRGSDRAAAPAATGTAPAADPLAGIEATVDAVDRETSADAADPDDTDARPPR